MPQVENKRTKWRNERAAYRRCSRCRQGFPDDILLYSCETCPDFIICKTCAPQRLYCENDSHQWVASTTTKDGGPVTGIPLTGANLRPFSKRYPSIFKPLGNNPDAIPKDLFMDDHRFINKTNAREILICTAGSCIENGQGNPKAGCAFFYRSDAYKKSGERTHTGTIIFALEAAGPTGEVHTHTSDRAELRAVIGALQVRDWSKDTNRAWKSVVIATDAEYIVINAANPQRLEKWESNGWKLVDESDVQNVDLWKLLLSEFRRLQDNGVDVAIWRIPPNLNERADRYAKHAAENLVPEETFNKLLAEGPKEIRLEPFQAQQDIPTR